MDELQEIWHRKEHEANRYSTDQLQKLLANRTEEVLSRVKRTMRVDTWVMILLAGGFMTLVFAMDLVMQYPLSVALLVLVLLLGAHYYAKYRLLNSIRISDGSLKDNLIRTEKILSKYNRLYHIVVPVATTLGFLVTQLFLNSLPQTTPLTVDQPWMIGLVAVILLIGVFAFTRWLVDRLYGKELQNIREIIDELTNQASA